jgi:hypothetical protein
MRRLSRAGFKNEFVRRAILPDWWDDACREQPNLLPEIELRVARFLGTPLAEIKSPGAALSFPKYANAQLRRVRDVDRDRLAPAIHSALRIGAAVVRCLRAPAPTPQPLPADPLAWREQIRKGQGPITLHQILDDLWTRGIPVILIDLLPSPSFRGIACVIEGRPVILLGHRHDEPGRVAFSVAHEGGHIAAGDCSPDQPVVDEEDEVVDTTEIEVRADRYATRALVGNGTAPEVEAAVTYKQLAIRAAELERSTGVDASFIISAWAARTHDYIKASMAGKALYRTVGARRQLRQHFDRHVDLDSANESDRALLRCLSGDPEHNETPH